MKYTVGIVVLSDTCAKGGRVDRSGTLIKEILDNRRDVNGNAVFDVKEYIVISDDLQGIEKALLRLTDDLKLNLILTTGGTGFSPRDNTPEATKAVIEREAPGISEAIRANGMKYTERAMLSRAVSGIRKNTLIVNLAGSPKAVDEALTFILDTLCHGLDILLKASSDCARK
ncbi:MAG: MogA/MoaB family molybdenum cofactor biosynthesis protein [Clostridiaceae bacterium]|jgi:molybdenum cofactor synthesis domain-containing protein|nr:MogA/MoaB family molybdenum cofactor biosynthesis protein [Clostridiaceae bacterium]